MSLDVTTLATSPDREDFETGVCLLCGSAELKTEAECPGKRLDQCLDCGVFFVQPQPLPDVLARHFENGGVVPSAAQFYRQFEANRRLVLAEVRHCIQSRQNQGSILDVGCATGLFLAPFANQPGWRAHGIEPAAAAAGRARRVGIEVHGGDTRRAKLRNESFDVITVLDAFYYFPRPAMELAEFLRILKPNGFLAIEVPWARARIWQRNGILGKLLNRSRVPLLESSDHLFYYTPGSISRLLEQCGFCVQAIRPLPGNRQETALRDFLWRTYGFLSRLLWRLSGRRIFLGPRFLVLAGKTAAVRLNPELRRGAITTSN